MPKLGGKGHYGNYDAHFAPVKPQNPLNPNEEVYHPCAPNEPATYHELVVFEAAQCLPRYIVELQPNLPKAPSAAITSLANNNAGTLYGKSAKPKPNKPAANAVQQAANNLNLQGW